MSSAVLTLVGQALAVAFAPVKTQLQNAETNPQAALSGLANLAATEIGNLPTLENDAIAEGAQLGLDLIAQIEAKFASAATPAPAPVPTPSPESAPGSAGGN